MSADDSGKTCKLTRRGVCRACIGGMAVASTATVGYPVASFVLGRPVHLNANKPLEIPLDRLPAGQAQYGEFQGQQVVVLMSEDGPQAFSALCPHLGCNVLWDAADGLFRCPCHGAVFDSAGQVVSGPVSAPLTKVPFEVKDGKLIIS